MSNRKNKIISTALFIGHFILAFMAFAAIATTQAINYGGN